MKENEELSFPSRVRKSGNSLYVLIPKDIAELLEIQPGDWVIIKISKWSGRKSKAKEIEDYAEEKRKK